MMHHFSRSVVAFGGVVMMRWWPRKHSACVLLSPNSPLPHHAPRCMHTKTIARSHVSHLSHIIHTGKVMFSRATAAFKRVAVPPALKVCKCCMCCVYMYMCMLLMVSHHIYEYIPTHTHTHKTIGGQRSLHGSLGGRHGGGRGCGCVQC